MPKEKSTTTTRKTKTKAATEGKKKKGRSRRVLGRKLAVLTYYADPNAPKRGLSAYMFFANEQRDNVREENPGISFGEDTVSFEQPNSY